MKINLTVSTVNFKHLAEYAQADKAIQKIRSLGSVPECWLNWDPQLDAFDRPNWPRLRELLGPLPTLTLHTRNDPARMFEEIELLAYLGGRLLVVHPCVVSLEGFKEEKPDLPFVRELAAAARERGVLLGLENIFGRGFLDRTLEGVDTFDARGGLGICIDIGHAELKRDQPRESAVDLIGDYGRILLHLHVHDVKDKRDHLALGDGTIDYAPVAAALRAVDFQGTAALEIIGPEPVAAAQSGLAYLKRHFGAELVH